MTVPSLLVIMLLLVANGFFVAIEFSLVATPSTRIEPLAQQGHRRASLALAAMHDLNPQLAGAQLGITMASLLLGFIAEPAFADLLEHVLSPLGVPSRMTETLGFVLALVAVTLAHMVIGEMIPKNLAIAQPDRTLLAVAWPNAGYIAVFRPVIWALSAAANAVVRLLGIEPRSELASAHTPDEIASMVAVSRREGMIEDVAHQLLTGALDLGDRPVRAVMTHREAVVTIGHTATVQEAEDRVLATRLTRLVVTGPSGLEDIRGFVHAKDLLTVPEAERRQQLAPARIRSVLTVGAEDTLDDALIAMQRSRRHLAFVTEPGGTTLGIVTLDDVLDALVDT